LTFVHKALERPPSLDRVHPGIIDYLTVVVPRVLLVAGLEGKRGMDDVAIDVVHLQSPTATVECGLNPLGSMIAVPQLSGDEDVLPPNRPSLERRLHSIADRFLIAVTFRTIEMPETHFQRGLGSLSRHDRIGYQRTKPDGGDCARSMGKTNPRIAKRIGGCHVDTPLRPTAAKSGMCSPYLVGVVRE
jgi:hypothetical protein